MGSKSCLMQDSQILSTLQELQPQPNAVFDTCQIGVVLRGLLLLELAVGVTQMFNSTDFTNWFSRFALYTGGALPGLVFWLLATCGTKKLWARLKMRAQYTVVVIYGALGGLYGCAVLKGAGLLISAPWLASAVTGALLSALLLSLLVMRARGETPATTTARLSELQARIRPHFLFNTLNSAIALVRAEPAKAEALLEDLSDLFRHALMDSTQSAALSDEIALARRYLDIEAIRFGERLRVQWDLDPEVEKVKLPHLLLQPLVENAVRHGVEPSTEGAQIRISARRKGSVVIIKVTNSVPAGQGESGAGLALANVRERLTLMYDVQAQFRSGLKDGIFQVRMEVPL